MAITFPNSPSSGDTHTTSNGLQYTYDGEKWTTIGTNSAGTWTRSGTTVSLTTAGDDLNVDSGTLFVDASANNVGIGTTSPNQRLTVGAGSGPEAIVIQSGSGNTGELRFTDTGSSGYQGAVIYNHPSSFMEFMVNSSTRMRIDSSGTSTFSGTSDGVVQLTTTDSRGAFIRFGQAGSYHNMVGCADGITSGDKEDLGVRAADNIIFAAGGSTERLRIDSSGRVGVGTSSPSTKLEVKGGDLLVNNGGSGRIFIQDTDATDDVFALKVNGGIFSVQDSNDSLGFVADIFKIYEGAPESSLVIDSSGNVGIGTSSPQHRLSVERDVGIYRASSDPTLSLSVGGTIASPTKTYNLLIDDSDSDKLQIRDGSTARVTLDSSGNVQIGSTNSDSFKFKVTNGAGTLARFTDGASQTLDIRQASGGIELQNPNNGFISFKGSSAERMRIDSSGNVFIGGTTAGTADIALNANGSATFAADVTLTEGRVKASRASAGTAGVFSGFLGSTLTFEVLANGSATFGQASNSTNNNGVSIGGNNGSLNVYTTRYSTDCFQILNTSGSGTNVAVRFDGDGDATFAGTVTASNVSDIRFKENITDANPQLADTVALGSQLKNFDWNDDAPLNEELRAKRFLGLIAQEAEKVCPGLTYTVPRTKQGKELTPAVLDEEGNETKAATYEELDDSYKAINHDILVMKLLGAVAELSAKVAALESA